jgi:hypothetical protein
LNFNSFFIFYGDHLKKVTQFLFSHVYLYNKLNFNKNFEKKGNPFIFQ